MKIGVISDSHDNLENLKRVLDDAKQKDVQVICHCGDIVAPFVYFEVLKNYTDSFKFYMVFGNNDGEKAMWTQISKDDPRVDMALGDFRELQIGDKKIFMTHYPEIAELAFLSKKYDAVFYGHTHKYKLEEQDGRVLLNPGEILAKRTGILSYAIYDTKLAKAEIFKLSVPEL